MWIFLDSAPLGVLSKNTSDPAMRAISTWVTNCATAGHRFVLPEIIDYEVRRELLRANKSSGIANLDTLKSKLHYLPLTTDAVLKAAELWALTRQQGRPTTRDENIDVDVILAAQALTMGVPITDLIVATANVRHLSLFVPPDVWTNIIP